MGPTKPSQFNSLLDARVSSIFELQIESMGRLLPMGLSNQLWCSHDDDDDDDDDDDEDEDEDEDEDDDDADAAAAIRLWLFLLMTLLVLMLQSFLLCC